MYTKETPLPLLRVSSRMDVHNSASWTLHCYSDDVIHHIYRRREHGWKDQEDYVGVLNILPLLGGEHWPDHMDHEVTAASPDSSLLRITAF